MTMRHALCLAALLGSGPAFAGAPTQVPNMFRPKPGPDAEILSRIDRYVLAGDGSVTHEHSERVQLNSYMVINRVLGETMVDWDPELETIEVQYNRTVLPSGEVVVAPANALVDDLPPSAHHNPLWARLRRKVIIHTGLVPGAVCETAWRITRRADGLPGLAVAEPLSFEFPVKDRVVEVDVPASAAFLPPAGATTEEAGGRRIFRFHAVDQPARPAEPGAPGRQELDRWALVGAGGAADPRAAAEEWGRRVDAAGPAPAGALGLAHRAADAIADPERRLLAILDALRDAMNLSGDLNTTRTAARLHTLEAVWASGWAAPHEMAALEAKVLESFGFQACPGLLATGPQGEPPAPGFALHDRAVLRVRMPESAGDRLYDPRGLDPEKPLELVPGTGQLLAPAGAGDGKPAPVGPWRRRVALTLRPDGKGGLAGDCSLEMTGAATPHAALVRDAQKFADGFAARWLEGAHAKDVRVTHLERGRAAITASLEVPLPEKDALGLVTLKLPIALEEPLAPAGPGRLSPVVLPGLGEETLELTLTLPKGWTLAAAPAALQVANPLGEVTLATQARQEGGATVLSATRRLTFKAPLAPAGANGQVLALAIAAAAPDSQAWLLRAPKP